MSFEHCHTKVIATLGPVTESLEMLKRLINEGVDVMRLNMAHGNHEWVTKVCATIRQASKEVNREVAIMMDIKGPEIRTGVVEKPLPLAAGDRVDFWMSSNKVSGQVAPGHFEITVNYPSFAKDVNVGQVVIVDNGVMKMEVLSKTPETVTCKVIVGGPLGSRKHINLPGADVDLPAVTQKDRDDLTCGIKCGIDWVAQSFVRRPDDIREAREFMASLGRVVPIIAKIEDQTAIRNLDEIIKETDAVMVARGDLGVEIPLEELPIVQERIINTCLKYGKPVIVATHMLESMITAPFPTRAEITDIAHAVEQRTDCVMLSAETTVGKFPIDCVQTLQKIATRIEDTHKIEYNKAFVPSTDKEKMILSSVVLAQDLGCSGIVMFTHRGGLARATAALRPQGCPIYAFTDDLDVQRQANLMWGIEPFRIDFGKDPEAIINNAFEVLKAKKFVAAGDKLVVLTNVIAGHRIINSIQLRIVE